MERIGHYTIVSELGRGGMGVVYKAHEESLNRHVAIKVLGEHLQEDTEYVERFVREARSAAALSHPNIVQIYSIAEDDGTHYFVMEFVRGTNVQQMIRTQGKLTPPDAARIILQAAAGLEEAHSHGVIHRDIKPANLMVTEKGLVKIADFGLAMIGGATSRLTATGMLMGTPGYLSPEQCLDQSPDHRTDIYSLGVTFFEMVTGTMPFQADSPLALLKLIVEVEPPDVADLNPEVDDELRSLIARMLDKDREQRYPSCSEIIEDLQSWLSARGEPLHPSTAAVAAKGPPSVPPAPPSSMTEEEINTEPTVAVDSGATEEPPAAPIPPQAPAPPAPQPEASETPAAASAPPDTGPAPQATAPATQPPSTPPRRRTGLVVAAVLLLVLAGAAAAAFLTVRSGLLDGLLGGGETNMAELDEAPPEPADTAGGDGDTAFDGTSIGGSQEDDAGGEPEAGSGTIADGAGGTSDLEPGVTAGSPGAEPVSSGDRSGGSAESASDAVAAGAGAGVAPPTPVPTPPPTATVVLAVGDEQLAVEAENYLRNRLARGGVELVEVSSIPGFEGLFDTEDRPATESVRDALRPYARYLIPVRAEYLGDREVYFMGQSDRVYQGRITVGLIDLVDGRQLGQRFTGRLEFSQLNIEGKVAETLRRPTTGLLQRLPRN